MLRHCSGNQVVGTSVTGFRSGWYFSTWRSSEPRCVFLTCPGWISSSLEMFLNDWINMSRFRSNCAALFGFDAIRTAQENMFPEVGLKLRFSWTPVFRFPRWEIQGGGTVIPWSANSNMCIVCSCGLHFEDSCMTLYDFERFGRGILLKCKKALQLLWQEGGL